MRPGSVVDCWRRSLRTNAIGGDYQDGKAFEFEGMKNWSSLVKGFSRLTESPRLPIPSLVGTSHALHEHSAFCADGSVPIDRADPSPSSIRTAVDILRHGEIILIFPSGTRSEENIAFKRGAAMVALHARVPLVTVFFQGPKQMQVAQLLHRPPIPVTFGSPIPTAKLPIGKMTAIDLTRQLQAAIGELRSVGNSKLFVA